MNFLYLFVIVPLLMMACVAVSKDATTIKRIMAVGSGIQLVLSFVLLAWFVDLRSSGVEDAMLFRSDLVWYPDLDIQMSLGVDGISVLMIVLSAIILQ